LFGFCGVSFWSVQEEAALVFGLAHLRFNQNVARPNTSTTSSSTAFLVVKTKKNRPGVPVRFS
jgi:hypothetical protein